ncbi:site-specific integrase [Halobacterium salinarum]|uniref:tyrosine-type recombinase/integrase n=1 Tax=Halobacterium salinarum TaxID=2242 RepID=UPI002556CC8D|nr:site-specific integrase [Halobacterium salinarum]MDL0140336.1 site-specific integrase [Halobacterium salinarum]
MSIVDPIEDYRESYVLRSQSDAAENTVKRHVRHLRKFESWLQERGKDLESDIEVEDDLLRFRRWMKKWGAGTKCPECETIADPFEDYCPDCGADVSEGEPVGYSEGTIKNATGAISKFFQIQRPDDPNPVDQWETTGSDGKWSITTEKKRATREGVFYLESDEVDQLIEAADGKRDTLIIHLLAETGMRRSELISLRLRDVEPSQKRIRIYERKNDEYRTVGFRSDKLGRELRMWIDHHRSREYGAEESDYLFPPDGKGGSDHLGETVVRDIVVEAADCAGIQDDYGTDAMGRTQHLVTPHALRATFAVQCAKNRIPAPMVKEALGHHSLDVTDIYTSVIDDDAADMIRRDGPSF